MGLTQRNQPCRLVERPGDGIHQSTNLVGRAMRAYRETTKTNDDGSLFSQVYGPDRCALLAVTTHNAQKCGSSILISEIQLERKLTLPEDTVCVSLTLTGDPGHLECVKNKARSRLLHRAPISPYTNQVVREYRKLAQYLDEAQPLDRESAVKIGLKFRGDHGKNILVKISRYAARWGHGSFDWAEGSLHPYFQGKLVWAEFDASVLCPSQKHAWECVQHLRTIDGCEAWEIGPLAA